MGIKWIIEESDTRAGRAFDVTILLLILISLASFSIETLPDLTPGQLAALRWVEIITVTLFTIEYLLRVTVASRRLGFVFSFFGLVDLIAILPFYLSLGIDLRAVRALRLLRIMRLFKLARYNHAMLRLQRPAALLGGHPKTGHRSTRQIRPPRTWRARRIEFYRRPSVDRKSACSLVRQLRGPHLSTWA